MKIFLTGGTGFVGSAVVADLVGAGYEVVGLARSDEAALALIAAGARPTTGELLDLDGLRREASAADAVIHTAFDHNFSKMAENCLIDRRAIGAMGDGMAGSGKLMIVTAGLPLTPGRVATEIDLPPTDGGGMPRLSEQAAMALLDRGVRAMTIRMSQVHDQSRQGFASYLLAHAREKGMSAYVGEGRNRWPAVHRLDAARLYRLALETGESGKRYHAVSEEGVSTRAIAETIGRMLGVPMKSLSIPDASAHFGWLDRIVQMDMPASSALTQQVLRWRERQNVGFLEDVATAAPCP